MTEESVIGYRIFKALGIMMSHPIKVSWCAPLDQETKDSRNVSSERNGIYKSKNVWAKMNQRPGKPQKARGPIEKIETKEKRTVVTECLEYIRCYARCFVHIISRIVFPFYR